MSNRRFIRQDYMRFSKLGKNRKKLQKWRRPSGRDAQMRFKRRGYPDSPSIGFKSDRSVAGLIDGKIPVLVHNEGELRAVSDDQVALLARVGGKKRLALLKVATELKLIILNAKPVGAKGEVAK